MRLAAAALVVTLLVPASASAFCRSMTCNPKKDACEVDDRGCVTSGVPVKWGKTTLEYRFSSRGSALLVREEARAAIRDAFNRWSDTLCDGRRTSLRFVEREDLADDKPLGKDTRGSEPFGIYFRDLGWPYDTPDETLAQTNHIFGKTSGSIQYSDLEINTGARKFATTESGDGVDLQAVMTHEAGHYIGLAHSVENESIMVKSYCEVGDRCEKGKVAARRLAPDDILAVCTLYPPDATAEAPTADQPSSAGGCSSSPSRPVGPFMSGLVLLFIALVRRRHHV
jgi:uncharacterized protein (TIGR03382 family)